MTEKSGEQVDTGGHKDGAKDHGKGHCSLWHCMYITSLTAPTASKRSEVRKHFNGNHFCCTFQLQHLFCLGSFAKKRVAAPAPFHVSHDQSHNNNVTSYQRGLQAAGPTADNVPHLWELFCSTSWRYNHLIRH